MASLFANDTQLEFANVCNNSYLKAINYNACSKL